MGPLYLKKKNKCLFTLGQFQIWIESLNDSLNNYYTNAIFMGYTNIELKMNERTIIIIFNLEKIKKLKMAKRLNK